MSRIAILEDDPAQAEILLRWLADAGHGCVLFDTGRALMKSAFRDSYDLFLLDWRTPQGSGDEVLAWIRERVSTNVPVLFATAMDDEKSIVHALDAGADDYLVKPLRQAELQARVRTLLRRAGSGHDEAVSITVGPYAANSARHTVTLHGQALELTAREFSLALLLFRNVGRILSRSYLLQAVWGQTEDLHTRRVDTHVSQIRQKLKLQACNGVRLIAIYQHGYRLELTAPPGEKAVPGVAGRAAGRGGDR